MEEFTSKPSESSEENKEDDIILTNGSGDSGLFLPKSTQETGLISPDSISTPVALALSSALKKIEDYVPTEYVDFEEPDIDAINLNHAEQAIMKVTNLMNGAVDVINGLSSQVAQLYSNLSNYYALQGGIAIPSGANLKSDTYRIPGNYYCPTNDIASTLINSPVKDAFILKVEKATGDSYPKQVFKEYNTGKIVSRVYSSSQGIWFDEISYVTNSDFQNKNFGPITGDEILSYADSVLAKSSIELIYITVQEVAGLIGFSGYCGGFISHRNDTVFIMFLSYSDNSIITNSRSRASDWKGWMKFKGVAI